jgi:hypothetical protein
MQNNFKIRNRLQDNHSKRTMSKSEMKRRTDISSDPFGATIRAISDTRTPEFKHCVALIAATKYPTTAILKDSHGHRGTTYAANPSLLLV